MESTTKTPAGGAAEITSFTYDRNGNQLTQTTGGQTETQTYNAFNQLIAFTKPDMSIAYRYRADGLRHSKTVNSVTTTYVWSGDNIVLKRDHYGGVTHRFYRSHRGELIACFHNGFYSFNARGDVVHRTDRHGNVIKSYRYDAFGNEMNPSDDNSNLFRFAGEYYDVETGTIYLRARNYNPRIGRFTQPDPHWNVNNMIFWG